MSTLIVMAFSRLQVWFDPAQTGSPYETYHPRRDRKVGRQYGLISKKLSIRV